MLFAYSLYILDGQVCNGYGEYVFENPVAKSLKGYDFINTAKILNEAKAIYKKYKYKLTNISTIKEFSELYDKILDFEDIGDEYYKINGEDIKIFKKYVQNNMELFCILI